MAATRVQTKKGNISYDSPLVLTWASNTTTGNTIIIAIAHNNDSAEVISGITDSQGNTYTLIQRQAVGYINTDLWYAYNITGGVTPSVTITSNGGPDICAIMREYSGLTTTNPLDKSSKVATGSSTSHTSAATAETTQANELVFAALGLSANSTYTLGAGYGNLENQNGADIYEAIGIEDKDVTATGAQTATFTSGTSTTGVFIVATFKEAAPASSSSSSSSSSSRSSSSSSSSLSSSSSSSSSRSSSSSSSSRSSSSSSSSRSSSSSSSRSSSSSSSSRSSSSSSSSSFSSSEVWGQINGIDLPTPSQFSEINNILGDYNISLKGKITRYAKNIKKTWKIGYDCLTENEFQIIYNQFIRCSPSNELQEYVTFTINNTDLNINEERVFMSLSEREFIQGTNNLSSVEITFTQV